MGSRKPPLHGAVGRKQRIRLAIMPPPEPDANAPKEGDRYRILLEATRTLGAKLTPDELHEAIYHAAAAVVEAPGFYLALHDQGRDLARVVYFVDEGRGQHVDVPYRGSDSGVITTQNGSIINEDLPVGALLTLGDENSRPTRSALVVPLLHDGRVLGSISAQSYEEGTYREADLEVMECLAGIAAVAVYNAQQFAELDRRRREAEQLEEIGRALTSHLDPDRVVGLIIAAVSDILEVDGVAVWLHDLRTPGLCRVADSGGEIALPPGLEWGFTGSMFEALVGEHHPITIDNLAAPSANLPAHIAEHLTGGSAVAVPLVLGEHLEGLLTAGSRQPRRFGPEDIGVLQRLAGQACVALANARLHSSVHALSLTDPLTGLPNRRRLQMHLDKEVAASRRGRQMSIAIFDIDRFKHYNDTFGHLAGDEILRAVSQVLQGGNRAMNIVARYGGDEFVSVLSDTGIDGAQHFVERVEDGISQNELLAGFGISVSVGCAEFDRNSMASVNDVLRAADADMYERKAKRREGVSSR
jgi:diguanylate cyclase (GGDEF)-like protein